jgi:hypothetical protein
MGLEGTPKKVVAVVLTVASLALVVQGTRVAFAMAGI